MWNSLSTKKILALANLITMGRIALCLPLIIAIIDREFFLIWIIILLSAASDIADGFLARSAGGGSKLGAFLDPMADKIFISVLLVWLCIEGILPKWSLLILMTREIIVTLWRTKKEDGAPASQIGKYKTIFQFTSVILLIIPFSINDPFFEILTTSLGSIFFYFSLLLAIISGVNYIFPKK